MVAAGMGTFAEMVYVTPTKTDGSPAGTAKALAAAGMVAVPVDASAADLGASAIAA
jgi:hypothetical protein